MRTGALVPAALAVLALISACIELPLERSNYYDVESGTRIELSGIPDTTNSVGDPFEITVTLAPEPSTSTARPEVTIDYPLGVLTRTGVSTFVTSAGAGYLPIRAVLRASFSGVINGPTTERAVIVRQRPVSLQLLCVSGDGCATVPSGGAVRQLSFRANDARGARVQFPEGVFRYGSVLSRDPTRVQVAGRPTGGVIEVRSGVPGVTWIVMTGDNGTQDSLRVEVLP